MKLRGKITTYTVEHYINNQLIDSDQLQGIVGALTNAKSKMLDNYKTYSAIPFQQKEILENGLTVVKIYYEEISNYNFNMLTVGADVDNETYYLDGSTTADIIPALKEQGLSITDVSYLILTHNHGDHAGGKKRILELSPNIKIVQGAGNVYSNALTTYEMKGHTLDCIGVFDADTGTLISGDGLQG